MNELIWHAEATIELSVSLPVDGGLPMEGKYETNSFHGAQIAFNDGLVYIRPDPHSGSDRVFVLPIASVKRAELTRGGTELPGL